jgi:hypothetical protein
MAKYVRLDVHMISSLLVEIVINRFLDGLEYMPKS